MRDNTYNACDFVTNRGWNHNYMWRIGDINTTFLHTGRGYENWRAMPLNSEVAQVMVVRVIGPEDYILLDNLTTGEKQQVGGIGWGGDGNVFKLFYNDWSEFFTGDFYWVYYSFELLTDEEVEQVMICGEKPSITLGDVNTDGKVDTQDAIKVIQHYLGKNPADFNSDAADMNGDNKVDTQDAIQIIRRYLNK